MGEHIQILRVSRGGQQVSFSEIADHLMDYVERYPEDHAATERLAAFLTWVEQVPHDHDADPLRGLPALERT
jgi:hypothetical protein